MLQNVRVTVDTTSELLRENQQEGVKLPPPSPRLWLKTYDNIRNIATGQVDHYPSGCLLDYPYFRKHFKIKTKDLRKQQTLDADLKAIQQINFDGNLYREATMLFIIEESKKSIFDFLQ